MIPRVLFVDDDRNLLSSYHRQYHRIFEVKLAASGEEALQILRDDDKPYWAVVSDYHMPGIDGLTFLGEVRRHDPRVVLLVITGRADLQVAIRAVNEGFVYRFLTKPVNADELLPILKAAFNQHKLNRMLASEMEKARDVELTMAMCSNCKKVRSKDDPATDQSKWIPVELFLGQRFGIELSHGLCPECVQTLYGAILGRGSHTE